MSNLATRMIAYLERHEGEWISKRHLAELARHRGFSYDATGKAFDELDHTTNIGMIYDGGAWYRWYRMSEEEIHKVREGLHWFDAILK